MQAIESAGRRHSMYLLGLSVLWMVLVTGVSGCGNPEVEVTLTKEDLQQKIAPRFPIEKKLLVAEVTLHSPEIYLTVDRVGMKISVDALLLKFPINGKVDIQGTLRYDAPTGQFFVSDVTVIAVELSNQSMGKTDKLKEIIAPLIIDHLRDTPVYTLPDDTLRQQLVGKLLKKVAVRDGVLVATFGK
jgi:hypothetical protein